MSKIKGPKLDRSKLFKEIDDLVTKVWEKHTRPHASLHESYGILSEEVLEFFQEVCKKKPDMENTREELIQIIAVCIKTLESHGL
jgi:NTP pyrophosphatase (non-canonical NTP hydrolase)